MLPFQNTTLYHTSLELLREVQSYFSKQEENVINKKIIEELLVLQITVAQAIEFHQENNIHQKSLEKIDETIASLATLFDIAIEQTLLPKEKGVSFLEIIQKVSQSIKNFKKNQKRILILSAEMGQGHLSAAKAVKEGLEHLYGYDYSVEIVDFMLLLSERINRVSQKTYEKWAKDYPAICNFFFESFDRKWSMKLLNKFNYALVLSKVKKFFNEKNPDLIISTFPVWDHLALQIVKKINPKLKFISIVTDSTNIHSAWATANIDYQIVANEDTGQSVRTLGIPVEKIKILGFPIRLSFLEEVNREEFLKKQGLDPKKFTILFLPAAQKKQRNLAIFKKLEAEAGKNNIIVITGRDMKSEFNITTFEGKPNIKLIGWTDEMHKFIKSSDVVITKGGGATVMECVAAEKPLIITWVIARHEEGNAEFIQKNNLGCIATDPKTDIVGCVKKIQENYETYKENLKKHSNSKAALNIAKFIQSLLKD